jgi:hypothetical protein
MITTLDKFVEENKLERVDFSFTGRPRSLGKHNQRSKSRLYGSTSQA